MKKERTVKIARTYNQPLSAIALLLIALLAQPVSSQAEALPRLIHINATGYIEAVPDQMYLAVTLKATRLSYEDAKAEVDAMTGKVLSAAHTAGIADDDLDSSQLTAFRETSWDDKSRQQVYIGDSVQRQVSMTITDLQSYPGLLKALSQLELHQISRPVLEHSTLDALKDAALRKALANGQRKAQLMAQQMGVTAGAVYSMSDQVNGSNPRQRMPRAAMAMDEMALSKSGSEVITLGKRKIYAAVSISFEIE